MFNLKDFIEDQREGDTDWEIDLSPLLALMVTLIPVLLLQTSFITLRMLETSLPIVSDAKVEAKEEKDKIDFQLNLFAKKDLTVEIEALVNKKPVATHKIPALDKAFNFGVIQEKLLEIKNKYPDQVSAKLTPDDKVDYKSIVKILDSIRKVEAGKTIKFTNKKGEKMETAMLFPDVVFGNIAE